MSQRDAYARRDPVVVAVSILLGALLLLLAPLRPTVDLASLLVSITKERGQGNKGIVRLLFLSAKVHKRESILHLF